MYLEIFFQNMNKDHMKRYLHVRDMQLQICIFHVSLVIVLIQA